MLAGAGLIGVRILSRRFEPYVRAQTIDYLKNRFASDVDLHALHVRLPKMSSLRVLLRHGRGAIARVEGEGLAMRLHGRADLPPVITIRTFAFEIDMGKIFEKARTVPVVVLDGMEINVPPRGTNDSSSASAGGRPSLVIEKALINNAALVILPRDPGKTPLRFNIHRLELDSAGRDVAMKYEARLTNAKPPGEIVAKGSFGPWVAGNRARRP